MDTAKCSRAVKFGNVVIGRYRARTNNRGGSGTRRLAPVRRCARVAASLLLALGLLGLAPQSARAGSLFVNGCFGDFSYQQVFDVADTICIDGDLDSLDFITFFGDAYIVPNQSWVGGETLVDVTSENRVTSGVTGGLFLGVPIGLPGGTPRGEYDVILDDGANGIYNPGYDSIVGAGAGPGIIVVESGRPIPDVSAMKARAAAMENSNTQLLAYWQATLDLIDAYNLASAVAGGPVGILEYIIWKPYNDLTGDFARKLMGGYGENPNPPPPRQAFGVLGHQAKRWGDLARDPPDPVFDVLVPLDIAAAGAAVQPFTDTYSYPFEALGTTSREANLVAWANLGVQQAAMVHALRQTFEKYQGADQADDDPYTWLQARQLKKYSEMLQANLTASIDAVNLVRADIIAAGDNDLQDVSALADFQARVIASGLTTEEQDNILALGFTPADIAEVELRIEGWVLPVSDGRVSESMDVLVAEMTSTRTQLATLASEAQALMDYLAPDFTLEHPTADAGGPYNGIEGTPVTLDGTGSSDPQADIVTFEWDLDGDGAFDDAAGTGPTHQWNSEFVGSIGLKVTDSAGNWDVAYADVTIGSANSAPQITDFQPASTAPVATAASPLNFSVTATDADFDALSYEWTVDGVPVGTGTTYTYTPLITDSGSVLVQVLVSDGSPFSVDVTESRRVNVYSDADGDSFYSDVDCDDGNASVNPAATDICNGIDDNCSGVIDEGFDADGDGVTDCAGDCDDSDPANYPGNTEVCDLQDNNCDGLVDEFLNDDLDGDGVTVCGGDCDDGASNMFPGNTEVCDGLDNNCDGGIDEGLTFDLDGDGYSTAASCEGTRDDCDDANPDANPGATEVCDLVDNDCDGSVDEGFDTDSDGYTSCGGDCNDADPAINPDASEICDDIDNNCDGLFDEGFDVDGDGVTTCGTIGGSTGGAAGGADCDDGDANSYPDAPEICDGVDNNCDGAIDEGVNDDLDGDGISICGGDCDDANPNSFPGNIEVCDLFDNNCDGFVDEGFDVDGDGFSVCAEPVADCSDGNADVYPGRPEVLHNYRDDDCDAGTREDYADTFIIIPDDNGRIYYASSNGDGSWSNYRLLTQLSGSIRGAAIADYDNDGDLDFVVGSPSGNTLRFHLFVNDGADNFADAGIVGNGSNTNSYQMDMAAGDFDNDGNMDFRSNGNSSYLHMGMGDGNGGFTVTTINTGISGSGRGMDAADFNHDGHLDFVRAVASSGQISLLLGDGSGNYSNAGVIGDPGTDPYGVTAADFNNDGHPDVLANYGSNGDPYLFAGNGDGTFQGGVYVATADLNNHGAFDNYDFNRDGNQDLVATNYSGRKIYYFPGNGDGTFGASVLINASNTAGNILGIGAPVGPAPIGSPVAFISPDPYVGTIGDTVDLSAEFSTDDGAIVDYSWDFGDGDTGSGETTSHTFPAIEDDYRVILSVTDDDGKVARDASLVLLVGDPPSADAGGPYSFGEDYAVGGVYTVPLDGSASSDDGVDPLTFEWDLGDGFSEDFAAGVLDPAVWSSANSSVAGEVASVAGAGWGNSYLVTKNSFPRGTTEAISFTGRVNTVVNPTVMWGLKNTNENYSYTQFTYAIYFNNNSWVYVYEDGASRGNKIQYTEGTDYEVRIDLKPGAGATYYLRAVGSPYWTEFYDSAYSSATRFRFGATVNGGTIGFDDFHRAHTSDSETPTAVYDRQDTFDISLKVTDIADQSDTDTTTLETVAGARPVADPGGPYFPGEASASCGVYNVTLDGSASSDDSGRIYRYDWDFGDGSTGTGVGPSHDFSAGGPVPGNFTVTLTVTDHALQQNTVTTTTTVEPAPGALPTAATGNYSVDESSANAGLWTVNFNAGASSDDNGLCDYAWDFGDGGSGSGVAPSHQYSATGVYNGTLTVRDHALQSHQVGFTVTVQANDPPVPDDGGPYAVDEGAAQNGQWRVSFDAGGSSDDHGVWKYEWDFGDGSTGSGETTTHDYSATGTYVVTLTVTDNAGQSTDSTTQVTVSANDAPNADAGPDLITERGMPVILDGSGSSDDFGILSYSWDFGFPPFAEDFSSALDTSRWTTGGAIVAGGEAVVTGLGGWGNRYLVTSDAFGRVAGDSYLGRIDVKSGGNRHVMWGLKDTGTNYSYTQFYYAIYFNNNNVQIYESGGFRGTFGAFTDNTSYDLRIDVKATGATYYYRETGAPGWTQIYDSNYSSAGSFRLGATVHSGEIHFDDFAGPPLRNAALASLVQPQVTYDEVGSFTAELTVTDQALQTDTDTATVSVVVGDAPVADAGGPYLTNEDIPTRFNGRGSTDDFGIKTYSWDFGDGSTLTTRNPFADHRYTAAGSYTVTLTVTDFAGQTHSDSDTVNVSDDPVVVAVPWRFSGGLEVPHDTWSGYSATLKAVAYSLHPPLTYEWDFGDGSALATGTVTDKRAISVKHTYTGVDGKPFTATIKITDANGAMATDTYILRIRARSQDIETNVAIDNGLWYLHRVQNLSESNGLLFGEWSNNGYFAHATASAVQAFEINGHLELGDVTEDPYVETVSRGLHSMFTRLTTADIGMQTYGNPDGNGNGIGVGVNSARPIYEGGMVMDAIASSASATTFADTGPAGVKDRSYRDIAQDMIDQYSWGQYDHATVGGGWRYGWNSGPDNSACQWAAIGGLALKQVFGLDYPQWVKDRNDVWLNYSFNGNGFGYTGAGDGTATSPSGLVQLIMNDKDRDDSRWVATENRIADLWDSRYNNSRTSRFSNYYSLFALTKSMRLALPAAITNLRGSGRNDGLDWFHDPDKGIAATLIEDSMASSDGSFAGGATWVSQPTRTAWGVIMLTPTLFVQPPVADAGSNRVWGVDVPITLDASGSFHQDPFRDIVTYEWDVDGDGVYDSSSTEPTLEHTYTSADYPEATLPQTVIVRLRVTDNNDPAQSDTDTVNIIIAVPPHPPVADIGGPYSCTAGLPCTLDGSGSFDIDPTDFITAWEWDLDSDGEYDDASGVQPDVVFPDVGLVSIGLRVVDNAVLNDENGNGVQDPEERLDDFDFVTVTVQVNNPPTADPGGPYTVDEGSSITLDGSASTDVDGNPITWAWDLDNDGNFDDATGSSTSFSAPDNGSYTVGLEVSDSLLTDSITTIVTVNNVAPEVDIGPDAVIDEGSSLVRNGSFTDPGADTWTATVDYGDGAGPEPLALNADKSFALQHVYDDNGVYTVTVTVTDDDSGSGSDSLEVQVNDLGPSAALSGDTLVNEGDTGSYDANASTSSPDAIVLYEWDWGYDGVSFDPSGDTGAMQTHNWPDDGSHTVAVRVTDDDGSSDIATLVVDVAGIGPSARLSGDTPLDEGQTGNYDASGSFTSPGSIVGYEWDWEYDGSTFNPSGDSGAMQSHVWLDDGVYTVAMRVTDDDGATDITTLQVTVNDLGPTAALIGDTSVDEGDTGNYDANGSTSSPDDIVLFEWDWNYDGSFDPSGDVGPMPSHNWPVAGNYTVAVRVTDDDGSTDIATLGVSVNAVGGPMLPIADLYARAKDSKIDLVWTPDPGASGYNVYRSTTKGGPYTKIADDHQCDYCAYADFGLTNGTTYFYVVTWRNGAAESGASNEASATPQALRPRR